MAYLRSIRYPTGDFKMNAYKNYVLTIGNIEASILAAEGTDEYISTLL